MSDTARVILSVEDFLARLDVRDGYVHTFRNAPGMLFGTDWTLKEAEAAARQYPPELAGPAAEAMGHGVYLTDHHGPVFFATKPLDTE